MSELRNKAWRRAEAALEELHVDPKAKKLVLPSVLKHNLLSVISKAIMEAYEYRDNLWKELAVDDICCLCGGGAWLDLVLSDGTTKTVACICPDGRDIKEVYGGEEEEKP